MVRVTEQKSKADIDALKPEIFKPITCKRYNHIQICSIDGTHEFAHDLA